MTPEDAAQSAAARERIWPNGVNSVPLPRSQRDLYVRAFLAGYQQAVKDWEEDEHALVERAVKGTK